MTELMSKFSKWLFQELRARNISQAELARATGLTRQAISYYLSEKSKRPDDDALKEIARVFKIPVEQIYIAADILPEQSEESNLIQQIRYFVDSVPEEEKVNIRDYAKHRFEITEQREKNESKQSRKKPITTK